MGWCMHNNILETVFNGKTSKLVVDKDTCVHVIYDGKKIHTSGNGTYNNIIKSGIEKMYLEIVIEAFIEKEKCDNIFMEIVETIGW